jgi:hypothetical protein
MNRLFIIGNGFDLAHGLPTRYSNFIDDFWKNILDNPDKYKGLVLITDSYSDLKLFLEEAKPRILNFECFKNELKRYCRASRKRYDYVEIGLKDFDNPNKYIFEFKSDFFRIINEKNSIENWVDIENEYYRELKNIVKSEKFNSNEKRDAVIKLNEELDCVTKLLENYLTSKINFEFELDSSLNNLQEFKKFEDFLSPISNLNKHENIENDFLRKDDIEDIRNQFKQEKENHKYADTAYFLNFNYTSTLTNLKYSIFNANSFDVNHIHGKLDDPNNLVNFGFGDEMDEDYRQIENLDDNEFLKNLKSFKYLQNPNYQYFLRFIEGGKFQVCILGHSCGLSDRVLLNTIFEHDNCRSIKVYYHQKENGQDNFTEIIQNISRHFKDKAIMREKIVNKSFCRPLPKVKLFLKNNPQN